MFNEIIKQTEWNKVELSLSTGKFARQAHGAIMVRMADSAILCTTVSAREMKKEAHFFPLTVNYQEKAYAAGKIPGGFFKRETGRSEKEILISRLIDRTIRPIFQPDFFNETQVLCNVHSLGNHGNTDILALIGASAALAISGVPLTQIVAGSRVGMIDNKLILNPTPEQLQESHLNLVVAGSKNSIIMVESEANYLTEHQMLDAIQFGHEGLQPVIKLIEDMQKEAGKPNWQINNIFPDTLKESIKDLTKTEISSAFMMTSKPDRCSSMEAINASIQQRFTENNTYTELQVHCALSEVKAEILRSQTLKRQRRIDGRKSDEIRDIKCEVSLFKSTHGSALFTRGETQVLTSTTLGTSQDEQVIDNIEGEYKENFLLNYIFPQYSVGDVGPMKAPSRREIGHGKLAWKALKTSLPSKSNFPYTIRVVSEVTESNGSSSMATVCGASMSMMSAGVPLKSPIAGIAMGLIKEGDQYMILSDISADEDYLGDMDLKVAGSDKGITALQMDIKISGITFDIMAQSLEQSKIGRIHILDQMNKAISTVSAMSHTAPLIETFIVSKEKIREIIGPGGKVIREICDTTGAKIDITDEGNISISAIGKNNLDAAINKIKMIAVDPILGDIFEGKVVKILDAGAFINYYGSRDGFVHISEISHERIDTVSSVLNEGQIVQVKLIGFDRGKAKLTIKNVHTNHTSETKEHQKVGKNKFLQAKSEDQEYNNTKIKRDNTKKWNNHQYDQAEKKTTSNIVTERKYFN